MYKNKFYNIIMLLICIGAFPVQILASNNAIPTDSSICHFNEDGSNNNNRQIIKCDHCDYFFDFDSYQNSKYNFPINESIFVTKLTLKKNFLHYILSLNPRSPPLV